MLRSLKNICCLLALLAGVQHAKAFTLLGEFDNWQISETGFGFGEIGGSKVIGEEFRINTPIITYGFDSTFLDFFGAQGVKAVDEAFKIMNRIPNVARMSTNLTEFLTDDAQRIRPAAEALNLFDLKSATLGLLIEHMGLAGEEHVFDLRKRIPGVGTCQFAYQVQLRNFDPVTWQPTRFVNGSLYTYEIIDSCPVNIAFAAERLVDPTDIPFNAVASFKGGNFYQGQRFGGYYINITRDDAGALRYMYRKDNYNNEPLPDDARSQNFSGPWQPVDFFGTNFVGTNVLSTNGVATRGGIGKVSYRKVRFAPIFGTYFKPVVQTYQLPVRTNDFFGRETTIKQTVRRLVNRPDILFTAADLNNLPPANPSLAPSIASRSAGIFRTNDAPVFSAEESIGPGIIVPQSLITFHKSLPHFFNFTDFFLDELTAEKGFLWASFDGSTNDPVIFPQGTDIREIERQVLSH